MARVALAWRTDLEGSVFIDSEHSRPDGSNGRGGRSGSGAWLALIGFIGLPMLAGGVGGIVSTPAVLGWYHTLAFPPGVPPDVAFGAVWTVLYALMGVAAWLVWRIGRREAMPDAGAPRAARALRLWGWQLLVNAAWVPVFFLMRAITGGLVVIVPLIGLIALTMAAFARVRPLAAWLLLPYLLWTCYATYLNAGFWWLNRA